MISIKLPLPPSTNNLYCNRRGGKGYGRIKTQAYRRWQLDADQWLLAQWRRLGRPQIAGGCEIRIRLPKVRGDISNRIKAAEDFLVSRLITSDDKNNRKVSVEVDPGLADFCVIELREAA